MRYTQEIRIRLGVQVNIHIIGKANRQLASSANDEVPVALRARPAAIRTPITCDGVIQSQRESMSGAGNYES